MMQQSRSSNPDPDLSGTEKAAALLMVMGRDTATRLCHILSKEELDRLVEAAHRLPSLGHEVIDRLVREFGGNYAAFGLIAGSTDLSQMLAGETRQEAGSEGGLIADDGQTPDTRAVRLFFETEPPQLSALLLDVLDETLVVEIFTELEADIRNRIFQAYLDGDRPDQEYQSLVASELLDLIRTTRIDEGNAREIEKAANLINQFSGETSDEVVDFSPAPARTSPPRFASRCSNSKPSRRSTRMAEARSSMPLNPKISLPPCRLRRNRFVRRCWKCSARAAAEWWNPNWRAAWSLRKMPTGRKGPSLPWHLTCPSRAESPCRVLIDGHNAPANTPETGA